MELEMMDRGGRVLPVLDLFARCADAVRAGKLIRRENRQDKEFHFQNWFKDRLAETGMHFEAGGRNSYPDFRMVELPVGFEVKGLAYPGREANYDCNSQVPSGSHNGRTIYYVFGRYPAEPDGETFPVLDLVVCHGDFLNADHAYVHKNRSVRAFGSYGDILIRDRKMCVAPTPFGITGGSAHNQTLIVPSGSPVDARFFDVGRLVRRETDKVVVGYSFDLKTNVLTPQLVANPSAGKEHVFKAYRLRGANDDAVQMRPVAAAVGSESEDELQND